jgi:ribosomal protein S18 acetylase RimI-like enzyme
MEKLIIRTYEQKDENDVIKLWRLSNLIVPQNDPKLDIKSKINFQPDLFFVGLLKNKLMATIMVGYEGHRGWINYLVVHPDYQRRGFGKQLMDHATMILSKMGCQKINVQVRESNRSVIQFYKNLGFTDDKVKSFGKRINKYNID